MKNTLLVTSSFDTTTFYVINQSASEFFQMCADDFELLYFFGLC